MENGCTSPSTPHTDHVAIPRTGPAMHHLDALQTIPMLPKPFPTSRGEWYDHTRTPQEHFDSTMQASGHSLCLPRGSDQSDGRRRRVNKRGLRGDSFFLSFASTPSVAPRPLPHVCRDPHASGPKASTRSRRALQASLILARSRGAKGTKKASTPRALKSIGPTCIARRDGTDVWGPQACRPFGESDL